MTSFHAEVLPSGECTRSIRPELKLKSRGYYTGALFT